MSEKEETERRELLASWKAIRKELNGLLVAMPLHMVSLPRLQAVHAVMPVIHDVISQLETPTNPKKPA